jgi:cell division protein FtsB
MAAGLLLVWLAFFDSHSLVKRFTWRQEAAVLAQENEELRLKIAELERQLNTNLSDEVIEQLARERYGMRRDGETVYKIEEIR